jgi:predicted nucleic acid-binding protein
MAQATYLLDTNVVAERRVRSVSKREFVSAVVLTELMASADAEEFKLYQAVWRAHERDGTLIVPTVEDWQPAARILHLLAQDRKKKAGGKSPRRGPTAKQELAMDVLIAVSAARAGVTVVTNDTDFAAIRYYHKKMMIKSGDEFFA